MVAFKKKVFEYLVLIATMKIIQQYYFKKRGNNSLNIYYRIIQQLGDEFDKLQPGLGDAFVEMLLIMCDLLVPNKGALATGARVIAVWPGSYCNLDPGSLLFAFFSNLLCGSFPFSHCSFLLSPSSLIFAHFSFPCTFLILRFALCPLLISPCS